MESSWSWGLLLLHSRTRLANETTIWTDWKNREAQGFYIFIVLYFCFCLPKTDLQSFFYYM